MASKPLRMHHRHYLIKLFLVIFYNGFKAKKKKTAPPRYAECLINSVSDSLFYLAFLHF